MTNSILSVPSKMTTSDERLKHLLIIVLQQPAPNIPRSQEMENLLKLTPRLPGILKNDHPNYLEAVNNTLKDVEKNIKNFPRQRPIDLKNDSPETIRENYLKWVNMFLRKDIMDLYRGKKQSLSLDTVINNNDEEGKTSHLDLICEEGYKPDSYDAVENWLEKRLVKARQKATTRLEQYIEEDPENTLKSCYCCDNPEANCQAIAKAVFLKNQGGEVSEKQGYKEKRKVLFQKESKPSMQKFVDSIGEDYQAVTSHWKRSCRKILKQVFNQFLQEETIKQEQ